VSFTHADPQARQERSLVPRAPPAGKLVEDAVEDLVLVECPLDLLTGKVVGTQMLLGEILLESLDREFGDAMRGGCAECRRSSAVVRKRRFAMREGEMRKNIDLLYFQNVKTFCMYFEFLSILKDTSLVMKWRFTTDSRYTPAPVRTLTA
jgi:hypothetical protein